MERGLGSIWKVERGRRRPLAANPDSNLELTWAKLAMLDPLHGSKVTICFDRSKIIRFRFTNVQALCRLVDSLLVPSSSLFPCHHKSVFFFKLVIACQLNKLPIRSVHSVGDLLGQGRSAAFGVGDIYVLPEFPPFDRAPIIVVEEGKES